MKLIDRVLCVTPAVLGLAAFIAGLRTEQTVGMKRISLLHLLFGLVLAASITLAALLHR